MSQKEVLKEKKREKGKLWVREWRPGPWREATEEERREIEEMIDSIFFDFKDNLQRLRRFWKKVDEAFRELWGVDEGE